MFVLFCQRSFCIELCQLDVTSFPFRMTSWHRNAWEVIRRALEYFAHAAKARYCCCCSICLVVHYSRLDVYFWTIYEQVSPSQFEAHAGWASRRKPWVFLWFFFGIFSGHLFWVTILSEYIVWGIWFPPQFPFAVTCTSIHQMESPFMSCQYNCQNWGSYQQRKTMICARSAQMEGTFYVVIAALEPSMQVFTFVW